MNREKLIPIAKGMITHLPGVKKLLQNRTGGTIGSRYCYSVWMRHLENWSNYNDRVPEIVAELGPGDSLGTGFAALLSGCKQLYALDVIKFWDSKRNLEIFEELVDLFKNKTNIPDNNEYQAVKPALADYSFPFKILSSNTLNEALEENRLNAIRNEISNIDNPQNSFIKYYIPWYTSDIINSETVDFIYSQAVLEYVEDLNNTYCAMRKWLKPSGLMSHTIDFKSYGLTNNWNGHWSFSDFEWNIVKGGKSFIVNRQPFSKHIELHSKYEFKILENVTTKLENKLSTNQISSKFRNLSDDDITTSGAYIISRKE